MRYLLVITLFLLGGCGAGLTQAEQAQYQELAEKKEQLSGELNKIQAGLDKQFSSLTRQEKKAGARTQGVLYCGVKLKRQAIGPLPFRQKRGYSVHFAKAKKASFQPKRCRTAKLKVTK